MQYTPNYNLITVEGTDVVNPLVQMNPNFTDIDTAMFANKQAVIGSATELTSGTVHSITRLNPDSNYFRFTATSNWTSGDSMSVDGVNVSVFLTDGTLPGTGAYVINTEVFGIIAGTRVTLYLTNPLITLPADHVTFDPSNTTLTATDVQGAIEELDTTVDILNNITVLSGGNVSAAYYKNGVVEIFGTVNANNTSGTQIFAVNDAKYFPIADLSYPCTRADSHGLVSISSSTGFCIYYCDAVYGASTNFHMMYLAKV